VEAMRQGEAGGRRGVGHLVRRRVVRREQHHARAAPACNQRKVRTALGRRLVSRWEEEPKRRGEGWG
jgi:hypothetical protein